MRKFLLEILQIEVEHKQFKRIIYLESKNMHMNIRRMMMRINYIQLKNFRQYKDMKIELMKNDKGDLHIFIANNGSGKPIS